jgi:sulfur-carrier protein
VLRESTGGASEVDAGGVTVGEVLRTLVGEHPGTERQIFASGDELNRYVNVYLNDEDVRVLDGLDTPVAEADTLVILPAMAGGQGPGNRAPVLSRPSSQIGVLSQADAAQRPRLGRGIPRGEKLEPGQELTLDV